VGYTEEGHRPDQRPQQRVEFNPLRVACRIEHPKCRGINAKAWPFYVRFLSASGKYDPLALTPRQTSRLPASNGAALPIVVERTFKTAGDVVTGPIARLRHRLGRSQAPASRTANEEEIVIQLSAKRPKLAGKTLHKARIHGLIRKGLPFDEDSPLAYGFEIRNPDIGPFRACADVNQLRARTRDEALPSRVDIDSVDWFSGVLHAQMIILP
jgi:hypothetical protein